MFDIGLHLANLHHRIEQLWHRWRQRREPAALDGAELERLASRLTSSNAHHMADLGAQSSVLLHRRLAALGITGADLDRVAMGLGRDLARTCACCDHKKNCRDDLSARPDATGWHTYCPNAIALQAARRCRGRFPA